jgi:hypothetical protein
MECGTHRWADWRCGLLVLHHCAQRAHRSLGVQQGPSKPAGMVTTASGEIDEDYYVKSQGIHPSFVAEMKALINGAHPRPSAISLTRRLHTSNLSRELRDIDWSTDSAVQQ